MMGKERRSMILSDEEKKTTAYHEAGHTLVAQFLPGTDPIHKVSIIPRGRALGVTMQLPVDDRHTYSKTYLQNNLAVLFGGRAAEELVFNSITTGAGNDIERATAMAKRMVCEWGMSEEFGPMALGKKDDEVFLGRDMAHIKDYSDETAKLIDLEVKRILGDAYDRAKTILQDNLELLHTLSLVLVDRETLTGEEVIKIINGETLAPVQNGAKAAAAPAKQPEDASGEEGFALDEGDSNDKAGQ